MLTAFVRLTVDEAPVLSVMRMEPRATPAAAVEVGEPRDAVEVASACLQSECAGEPERGGAVGKSLRDILRRGCKLLDGETVIARRCPRAPTALMTELLAEEAVVALKMDGLIKLAEEIFRPVTRVLSVVSAVILIAQIIDARTDGVDLGLIHGRKPANQRRIVHTRNETDTRANGHCGTEVRHAT